MLEIFPAYGRDYTSRKKLLDDLSRNKDFRTLYGTYLNLADLSSEGDDFVLKVYYRAQTSFTTVTVGEIRKCAAANAASPSPKPVIGFAEWMKRVDRLILERTGLTSSDLPDQDYSGEHAAGTAPQAMAKRAIKGAVDE